MARGLGVSNSVIVPTLPGADLDVDPCGVGQC